MAKDNRRYKLMAKPIEATPVLKGQDLISFASSLKKQDSPQSEAKRKSALTILKAVMK